MASSENIALRKAKPAGPLLFYATILFLGRYSIRSSACASAVPTPTSSSMTSVALRNARWLVRGIGSELLSNVVTSPPPLRHRRLGRSGYGSVSRSVAVAVPTPPPETDAAADGQRPPVPPSPAPVAVVTGATGGIGLEICRGLASDGYHVYAAARDPVRGKAVADRIRVECGQSGGGGGGTGTGTATFVEWHADDPASSLSVASALRGRPVALLVNNAGTMGGVRSEILRVNLIGPASLTLALLPGLRLHPNPRVVNVGSSSHLRAGTVDPALLSDGGIDGDLSAYGQSKLGTMLLSVLLRRSFPAIEAVDAHPGLVWTPMLRNNLGRRVASMLEMTGIGGMLFKSPEEGAASILAAVLDDIRGDGPPSPSSPAAASVGCGEGRGSGQTYYVNCRPGGYASPESSDELASWRMWRDVLRPALDAILPEACREVEERGGAWKVFTDDP